MKPKFDLQKLKDVAAGLTDTYHLLTAKEVALLLAIIQDRSIYRGAWVTLTDAEWDDAKAIVDGAIKGLTENMLTGLVMPFAGDTAPSGFLLCDGSEISRADYATLFDVIGTKFGEGDGLTTFGLPNLAGRVPIGLDNNQPEFDALGKEGGETTHTLTALEMPTHTHQTAVVSLSAPAIQGGIPIPLIDVDVTDTGPAGGSQPHNNLPPYLVINYIIKT